ncbi:MAG: transposase [Verrucomicrobiota bacterium JB023]|nr:transposase [Verrucomicrobiota bacterium JB023]
MRRPRLKAPSSLENAYYHCVSRVVNRNFVLGKAEKDQFRKYMRLYEKLYRLRVVSYCIMSNHFHILVEVPKRPEDSNLPDDEGLIRHVAECLGEEAAASLRWELEHFRKQNNTQAAEALREKWFARMWDVSAYMKVLKQRFTQWFNRRHQRKGTLWEERFRSVLVEGKGNALKTIAAYIDLNPVRAKICDDPKNYRWCGYGEAVGGGKLAKEAVAWLDSFESDGMGGSRDTRRQGLSMKMVLERYRCFLFGVPESEAGQAEELAREKAGGSAEIFRKRIPREKALEVLKTGGRLERADYLRCRVRYFIDGVAIGSKVFLEEVLRASQTQFSPTRKKISHSLRGIETVPKSERLYNLRQLQKDVVS